MSSVSMILRACQEGAGLALLPCIAADGAGLRRAETEPVLRTVAVEPSRRRTRGAIHGGHRVAARAFRGGGLGPARAIRVMTEVKSAEGVLGSLDRSGDNICQDPFCHIPPARVTALKPIDEESLPSGIRVRRHRHLDGLRCSTDERSAAHAGRCRFHAGHSRPEGGNCVNDGIDRGGASQCRLPH